MVSCIGAFRVQSAALADVLELTDENVEMVLDEIRPYLMAGEAPLHAMHLETNPSQLLLNYRLPLVEDCCTLTKMQGHKSLIGSAFACLRADGGNVELVEIDGPIVYLRLQGACGSCPSSLTTMTMGIKRRLQEKIPVRLPSLCYLSMGHEGFAKR